MSEAAGEMMAEAASLQLETKFGRREREWEWHKMVSVWARGLDGAFGNETHANLLYWSKKVEISLFFLNRSELFRIQYQPFPL